MFPAGNVTGKDILFLIQGNKIYSGFLFPVYLIINKIV